VSRKLDIILTSSSIRRFYDCRRRYYYEYVMRLTPRIKPAYFEWGSLVHRCFELLEKGFTLKDTLTTLLDENKSGNWSEDLKRRNHGWISILPKLVLGYQSVYGAQEKDEYETLQSEQEFNLLLDETPEYRAIFRGKRDALKRHKKTGEVVLWERKTASQTGDSYWENVAWDPQPKSYLLSMQLEQGIKPSCVVYDVIKKPLLKQKPGELDSIYNGRIALAYIEDKYFERKKIYFTPQVIEAHYRWLRRAAQELYYCYSEGQWNEYHLNQRWPCEYRVLCPSGGGEENEHSLSLFDNRRADEINPELSLFCDSNLVQVTFEGSEIK